MKLDVLPLSKKIVYWDKRWSITGTRLLHSSSNKSISRVILNQIVLSLFVFIGKSTKIYSTNLYGNGTRRRLVKLFCDATVGSPSPCELYSEYYCLVIDVVEAAMVNAP
jgi:hypothetical protein